jgi:hypothetical protein
MSDEQMFVVHRESANKPNMKFLMHESGLHYYDPRNTKNVRNDVNLGCDKNFILLRLSRGTSKVLRRGRSRVQKPHGLCMQHSVTRPGRILNG